MQSRFLIVLILITVAAVSFAQDNGETEDDPAAEESAEPGIEAVGIMLGGLITPDTGYAVTAGTYSQGRFGYHGDVFVDIGSPTWDDGSSGSYYHIGGSLGIRLSALGGGRGLLVGVGLGGGYSSLTVTDGSVVTPLADWQLGIVTQFGGRFGRERGFFGEAIMRLLLPVKPIFMYAGDEPPETEVENLASIFRYQAVYMPNARAVGRFYLGVGYTFSN